MAVQYGWLVGHSLGSPSGMEATSPNGRSSECQGTASTLYER